MCNIIIMNSMESVNFSSTIRRSFITMYIFWKEIHCVNSCKAGSSVKVHSLQTAQVKIKLTVLILLLRVKLL